MSLPALAPRTDGHRPASPGAARSSVARYVQTGIAAGVLDPALGTYDLERIAAALRPERDLLFSDASLRALYDHYLRHTNGRRDEPPQLLWLRVAMGLALGEEDREGRAIAFYDALSRLAFVPPSPVLRSAGTHRPLCPIRSPAIMPDGIGAINLPAHLADGKLDRAHLRATVRAAVRMLDNAIDLADYPTAEARTADLRHRPIGLGITGLPDALSALGLRTGTAEAAVFADRSAEAVAYFAILASTELAHERGPFPGYADSPWERGLLPIPGSGFRAEARGLPVAMMPWERVRNAVWEYGMRNSTVMAPACVTEYQSAASLTWE